jgi:three-Cys-motif partner protein
VTPRRDEDCYCTDGLRCRSSGEWARTKLQFIDDYVPPALAITHRFPRRWYVDLFAGPGRNRDRKNQVEFDGSPLRSLILGGTDKAHTPFTDAVFVNRDPRDHGALSLRVQKACEEGRSRIPWNRITLIEGDANRVLGTIMSRIGKRDYVVAFADITGINHWPFSSVRELRQQGHKSVDFYALFPLEMALVRMLSYDSRMMERYADALTAFFDGAGWRAIAARRRTPADTPQLKAAITALYKEKLETVWEHVDIQTRVGISEKRRLYSTVFATDAHRGKELAAWQRKRRQQDFFG